MTHLLGFSLQLSQQNKELEAQPALARGARRLPTNPPFSLAAPALPPTSQAREALKT